MDLSGLRTASRQRADEESDGFISNSELDNYINQGVQYIFAQMCQRFEDYFIVAGDTANGGEFDTVNNQQLYAMPSDLHKLVKVEMRDATSNDDRDYYRLRKANIANQDYSAQSPSSRLGYYDFQYYVAGNKIGLRPIPSGSANTVRLWFIPFIALLVQDTDIPEIPLIYHNLIADYAAIKCLSKSGEGIYKEKFGELNLSIQNLLDTVEVRDQQAEQMTFTDSDYDDELFENRFPWRE